MLKTAQAFMDALTQANLKYKDSRDMNDGNSIVICGVNGKNNARYDVIYIFDKDETSVSVRIFKLLNCAEDKTLKMLDAVNEVNAKYRWLKFYLNKEQDLNVQIDAYIDGGLTGKTCIRLLLHIMKIIDECYPTFMHVLWA